LVPTVAVLGVGAAIAGGQVGGSDSTITGCWLTNASSSDSPVGSLRVISPTVTGDTSCTDGETPITWNQQVTAVTTTVATGPTGATGPQGPPGPQGPAGAAPVSSSASADIVGETTQPNAGGTKAFDLSSFTLDAQNSLAIGSATAGAGAGKVSFQGFSFTKPLDKYSAQLFQDLASGTRIASVEIIVRKPADNGMDDPIVQYLLKNVGLTNIHISGASKNATETIQGAFQAISFVLYGQNSNGTTPVTSTGGWSQVTNQPVSIPGLGPVGTIRDTRRRK
jgi:type VI protein secretion system component Hcp